ncbi:MAG: NAD(P)/FAD-dependent oxidoreductase, partial [Rhodospirillaceae bacterium]
MSDDHAKSSAAQPTKQSLVVIGNGMAGLRAVEDLLAREPNLYDITIFGAEPRVNYNRIMLSPLLAGEKTFDEIVLNDEAWYAEHNITLIAGDAVVAIDRTERVVRSASGKEVSYDRVLLATGSNPIMIPFPGIDLPGVISFRDVDDVNTMLKAAETAGRAVVIGGGLLGLEAANGLRSRGMAVTVIHLADHLMERQLDSAAGFLLKEELEERGIEILTSANTDHIAGTDHVEAVVLKDGRTIPADLVVMAVGIRPNAALAQESGLEVNRGILVDDRMTTSDPEILALGECIEHDGACYGLVAPIWDMAKVVGANLAGDPDGAFVPSVTAT